jgi:hypothetical protein
MEAWGRGTIRPPERPSTIKYAIELVSLLLITGGIVGELWIGVKITSLNGVLRSENAELRTKSDQLVELLHRETENESVAREAAEESIAWRRISLD